MTQATDDRYRIDRARNRLVRISDGYVAAVYSPGYGAGWSSWEGDSEAVLFDPDIALMVLAIREGRPLDRWGHDRDELDEADAKAISEAAKAKFGPNFYTGGADTLSVAWLKPDSRVVVHEYDGSESLSEPPKGILVWPVENEVAA